MDSNNEHTSDIDTQYEELSNDTARRKATEELVEKPNAKKIRVNIINTDPKTKKSSYVWEYFQVEDGRDVCKIITSLNGKEIECKKSYKHDGGTGNMKQHLQFKHEIFPPGDLPLNPNEKYQTRIDKMIKKVTPHRASKQAELKQVTAEWLITDSLPFNVVHKKGYRKMIERFDPAFILPNNKSIKKELALAYQKGVLALKELISTTCETASITTDLWTARSNDGYIGVTLHWLSSNFEIYDVILAVEKMEYPHTSERIKEYLNEKIKEFGLTGKIVCAVTDNGANMKKAIRIWDGVERLPCSAHTLQLTVIQGLKAIKPYTKRFRKLVKFFRSSKQSQRLDQAQIDLAQRNKNNSDENLLEIEDDNLETVEETEFKILRIINDVKTRWNSTYQ